MDARLVLRFRKTWAKKLSYAKERHFHGLSVVKIKEDPISDDTLKEISEKFYILQDRHDLSKFQIQNEN